MFQMREAFLSLSHFYVETHWSSKTIHIWVRGGGEGGLTHSLHFTKFQKSLNTHPEILADISHKENNNCTFLAKVRELMILIVHCTFTSS